MSVVNHMGAVLGHEINDPLNSLTQALFLAGQQELPLAARGPLKMARQELDRLADAMRRILGADLAGTPPQLVRPGELIEEALTFLGPSL